MRFAILGSGSRGNGLLVAADGTRVLVDCGFSVAEAERRLARLGCDPGTLAAIVLTHEHGDHARGALACARRWGVPLHASPGTLAALGDASGTELRPFDIHEPFAIGALRLEPFPVPHDAREPCQLVLGDGDRRLGLVTDAGHVTAHMRRMLERCHGLLIECNHDPGLLARGPYPGPLKARVGGAYGHLSNPQAAELLGGLAWDGLRHVVAMHLSEQNNTPAHARSALAAALGCAPGEVLCAAQDEPLPWMRL